MNHLAHFDLASPDAGLIVGALLADYRKGPVEAGLPAAVAAGVRLHRRIDGFTDWHPRVRALRRLFDGPARRLAGIALDLHFDRLLVRHWARFHDGGLADFAQGIYAVLDAHAALLPPAGRAYAERLCTHDLLCRYGDAAVVDAALERIGERLRMAAPMRAANAAAHAHHGTIEQEFLVFYPEAIATARAFRAREGGAGG